MNSRTRTWVVASELAGTGQLVRREYQAEHADHARELATDAFPDETLICIHSIPTPREART